MENKEQKQVASRWKRIPLRLAIGLVVLIMIPVAVFFISYNFIPKNCDTAECFIAAAADCSDRKKVKFEALDEAGALWQYRVSGCEGDGVFRKTLIRLNQNEPAEMREFLEGKSLSCAYVRGEYLAGYAYFNPAYDYLYQTFDERWVKTTFLGIENCQGELKEAIGELLLLI